MLYYVIHCTIPLLIEILAILNLLQTHQILQSAYNVNYVFLNPVWVDKYCPSYH